MSCCLPFPWCLSRDLLQVHQFAADGSTGHFKQFRIQSMQLLILPTCQLGLMFSFGISFCIDHVVADCGFI